MMKNISFGIACRETERISANEFNSSYNYYNLISVDSNCNTHQQISNSLIMEIVPTEKLLFVIDSAWKCFCIDKISFKMLFELTQPGERSRTIFYNKYQESVIIVFLQNTQVEERLICKSYDLLNVENKIINPIELFPREDLRTPGFLEFDDLNKLIMTRSASTLEFKFWKLEDYSLIYTISDPLVEEIRLTIEVCLLIHTPQPTSILCKLCSVETGSLLDAYEISIKPHRQIELLELFGCYLLIKQYGEFLLILNLLNQSKIKIEGFISPQNFIYLHEKKVFLALRNCVIEVWNFDAKLLKIFSSPAYSRNGVLVPSRLYISRKQDMIMFSCIDRTQSLCRNAAQPTQQPVIKIFRLLSGELIREIKCNLILDTLSTLTYDENFGTIYIGHADGFITRFNN